MDVHYPMHNLEQIQKELGEFKSLVNRFLNYQGELLYLKITTDLESLLDEIKHARGYVDCMIERQIAFDTHTR